VVVGGVMAVLAAGLFYLVRATPLYTSTSRVYVEQRGPRIIHEVQPGIMTGSMNYLHTQAELMKATSVVSEAIAECGEQGLKVLADVESSVEFLKERLEVSVGREDDIIRVSFQSPYAVENARVVNAVVDAYMRFHAASKQKTSGEVLKILQKERAAQEEVLSERARALTQFREDHPDLAFQTARGNAVLERFERLSAALTEAQLAALEAQSYYEAAKQMADDPADLLLFAEALATKTQGPDTATLDTRLRELKRQHTVRRQLVTADHPSIEALATEIAQIEAEIASLEQQSVTGQLVVLKQQYLTAREKEQQLSSHFEQQRMQVTSLNKVVAQYALLESAHERTKKVCDVLEDRIREVDVTEDTGALNIAVLETALPTRTSSEPQKARVMVIALVLGLMLGGSLAVLRELTDQRLRTVDEVATWLGIAHLGVVPRIAGWGSVRRARKTATHPSSPVAEAFRNIRTSLHFGVLPEQSRVIQVTSSLSGEGKSTFVSNLGVAMAQSGQTVLIVDADFRKPVQHKMFGVTCEKGLSSVLARTERLSRAIISTSTPGLFLLPAGPQVAVPAEMFGGTLFGAVLAKLAQPFDRILVDTPAMRPTADARIVATRSQAVILVLRRGVCTYPALRYAHGLLRQDGSHVIGAVGNGFCENMNAQWVHGQPGGHAGDNGKRRSGPQVAALPAERIVTSPSEQAQGHAGSRMVAAV